MLEQLRVMDLRLRGRGFTLFPAAKEEGIEENLMDFLVFAIYRKLGLCSGDYDKEEKIKKENPNIKDTIYVEDLKKVHSDYDVDDLVNNGLVVKKGKEVKLTEKSIKILKRAAQIQNELDDAGFSFCPCHQF